MINHGLFTISIDLELAWGICDKPIQPHDRKMIGLEREIVQQILSLFSKYDISATWAVVGHLLLTECSLEGETVHPEIERPIAKNLKRDWFFQHPNDRNDLAWYGRDIIEWIQKASPAQDIGSHSFAHVIYDEKKTHYAAIESDIKTAKHIHDASGLPFEAFVFPRNVVGQINLLGEAGVKVYRGNSHRWYHAVVPRPFQRLLNLLHFLLAVCPPTVTPKADVNGIVNIPDSMLLLSQKGVRRLASRNLIRMGKAGLDRAAKRNEIFHLWFHPSNFAYHTESQFRILEFILSYAYYLRENGLLDILNMSEVRRRIANE